MATSIVPALLSALVSECGSALSQVAVYDGYGVSGDITDNLMVGVDDPFSDAAAPSAESQQSWANVGRGGAREESGEVTCAAYTTSGDTDQAAVREAVYAITAGVEDMLRDDPTVGLGDNVRTQFGTDQKFLQDQDPDGAWALVIFTVKFDAYLTR